MQIILLAWLFLSYGTVLAADNPVPFVSLPTVPSVAAPGGAGFTLTVNGANFVNGSVINWNSSPRATTFLSTSQLTAAISAADIASASTVSITVTNPAPLGGTSNIAYFEVTHPTNNLIVTGVPLPFSGVVPIVADLNNDGKQDLLLFSMDGTQVSAALGNANGSFQPTIPINLTGLGLVQKKDAVLGDFNADGKLDLALIGLNQSTYIVSVLLGNGDGSFQPPMTAINSAQDEYSFLVAGDFNRDGKLDLIAQSVTKGVYGDKLTMLLGNGDGTFEPPVVVSSGFNPTYPFALGSFSGDGILDLLGFENNEATTALGNGDGTFQPPLTSNLPPGNTDNVWVGDFNGDGKLDTIASIEDVGPNGYALNDVFMVGAGDGTFSALTGRVPGLSVPGDITGDGKSDIVSSPAGHLGEYGPPDSLSLWIGNGDGTFAPGVSLNTTTGHTLYPLLQGDFNNDGRTDLLAIAWNAQTRNFGGLWLFMQGSFPVGSPSPSSLNFGNQTINTTIHQAITLSNPGMAASALSAFNLTGSNANEFQQVNNCPASLSPGGTCLITVSFTPSASGTALATLNIPHDGLGPQSIPLAGNGDASLPVVRLSPSSLNFPAQALGAQSSLNIMLTNVGPGTLSAPVLTVSGQAAADFSATSGCGSGVLAGASCQITVKFTPSVVGSRSAKLSLSDNADDSPQTVTLVGSGPDFSPSAPTPSSLIVSAGQTANYTFGITPVAGFAQIVELRCAGAPRGAECMLPSSVTLDGSSQANVAVSVSTASQSSVVGGALLYDMTPWFGFSLLGFPLLVNVTQVFTGKGGANRFRGGFLSLLIALLITLPACGGRGGNHSESGTPKGTYHLDVTSSYSAGGATLTHTVTLSLIVQ